MKMHIVSKDQPVQPETITSKNSPAPKLFNRSIRYLILPSIKFRSRIPKDSFYEKVYKPFQKRQLPPQDARRYDHYFSPNSSRVLNPNPDSDFDHDPEPDPHPTPRKYEIPIAQYFRELIQLDKCYKKAEKFIGTENNFGFKSSIFERKNANELGCLRRRTC